MTLRSHVVAEIYRDMARSYSSDASKLADELYELMEKRDATDSISERDQLTKDIAIVQAKYEHAKEERVRLNKQADETDIRSVGPVNLNLAAE